MNTSPAATALDVADLVSVIEDLVRFSVRLPTRNEHSLSELGLLRTLTRSGPLRVSDLATTEGMTQPGMTQLVAKLVKRGYVRRTGDPADKRAVLVSLTDDGAEVAHIRRSERIARFEHIVAGLSDDERARLESALPVLARLVELGGSLTSPSHPSTHEGHDHA